MINGKDTSLDSPQGNGYFHSFLMFSIVTASLRQTNWRWSTVSSSCQYRVAGSSARWRPAGWRAGGCRTTTSQAGCLSRPPHGGHSVNRPRSLHQRPWGREENGHPPAQRSRRQSQRREEDLSRRPMRGVTKKILNLKTKTFQHKLLLRRREIQRQ